jgi:DNA-binding CsgD family transcriptional regulator
MYQRYLERIEKIADFLAKVPHPDQAMEFLSLHISPIDEVAVAYRGIVDPDGSIRCVNINGFSKNEIITKTQFKLSDNRPISVSARTQKIVWARFETVSQDFPDFFHFDQRTPWESQIALPVGLTRVYSFSFPSDHSSHEGMNSYVESIGSMLKVYESALEFKSAIGSRSFIEESEVQPLSERQNRILDLLKLGRTNKEIADSIGYSESLVRHETMIIYKKLRVEGRHELRESV